MMVIFSVNLKMAFIDAGSDNGEIIDAKHLKSLIAVRKRFLKSDVELAPIRLFSVIRSSPSAASTTTGIDTGSGAQPQASAMLSAPKDTWLSPSPIME